MLWKSFFVFFSCILGFTKETSAESILSKNATHPEQITKLATRDIAPSTQKWQA